MKEKILDFFFDEDPLPENSMVFGFIVGCSIMLIPLLIVVLS